MKFAYQGVPGAYSEQAGRDLFGKAARAVPCESFEAVFDAVAKRKVDRGVIPVENSLGGSIHLNYDLLARHALTITRETYVRVEHALMALPGTRLSGLRAVLSHPQALAQCSDFFTAHPNAKAVPWYDTAGAARSLAEDATEKAPATIPCSLDEVAVIASEDAAKIYGLKILKRRLQNRRDNYTRFLCISRKAENLSSRAPLKTSLTFIPARNRAGVLHAVTGVFASRGIDLTKIESRPDPENPFDYRFYLDASGSAKEAPLREALAELKKFTRDLRVLGSYPRGKLRSP
ncbi:MAG TPA: prephenate dehydratase [Fibrobacteria bacterium]|nr:prephenate dehydratase [Fibrobacteria bacterium]